MLNRIRRHPLLQDLARDLTPRQWALVGLVAIGSVLLALALALLLRRLNHKSQKGA